LIGRGEPVVSREITRHSGRRAFRGVAAQVADRGSGNRDGPASRPHLAVLPRMMLGGEGASERSSPESPNGDGDGADAGRPDAGIGPGPGLARRRTAAPGALPGRRLLASVLVRVPGIFGGYWAAGRSDAGRRCLRSSVCARQTNRRVVNYPHSRAYSAAEFGY
jgi:hypothetical protein